jgi:hypothetical protein
MKNVKKIALRVLAALVILAALYIGFNQFDGPRPVLDLGGRYDTSSFDNLVKSVFPPANFEPNNGYYRLWTLAEPLDADIESEETLLKYRRMHDPAFDNTRYLKEWNADKNNWRFEGDYRGPFKSYTLERRELLKKHGVFDSFSGTSIREWPQFVLAKKEYLLQLKSMFRVFLRRYEKLVASEVFVDFTLPRHDATLPHLLAWLLVGRLYNTVNILEALEGDWENAVSRLLAHVDLHKKIVGTSRTILVNLVGKAVMREALYALVGLMNEPEFPDELYEKIARGLPPMKYEEFGTLGLVVEGYSLCNPKKGHFLMQPNRTGQYFCDYVAKLLECDWTPPYQWKFHPLEDIEVKTGWFWWLQNPVGKIIFQEKVKSDALKNLFTTTHKSYWLKAAYDMTRITAELHRAYVPGKPVQEILNSLETYRTWVDPCSGKPYVWNDQKQLLYSIGIDREDDGGVMDFNTMEADYTQPVILYIKD